MKIISKKLNLHTKGNPDFINITPDLSKLLESAKIKNGSLTVFVVGSTAGITTFEYEPGLVKDMADFYEKVIPQNRHYHHDDTWGDANGYSHLRASITGASLTIPFEDARLLLGTWQQVVLAEFDNHPRSREVIIHIIGE
ncbi:MAG: secondary thiamine-phosphate synthase enzyme [Omnitrophica WOR_2 bacterium RBG_13_44_8b]|nr:MAG: secondary thiamine-phosphate synthase enzyme [Omnitrophica WOR_2 bacterium RBG_13_44_8b]